MLTKKKKEAMQNCLRKISNALAIAAMNGLEGGNSEANVAFSNLALSIEELETIKEEEPEASKMPGML